MNLMIVEDEPRLRESIACHIAWNEHGIHVAALAADGVEALTMLDKLKPELVLLDIEMPGMNGLEFARSAMERQPLLKIVILSGHDDFHYAQEAIQLGASRYLLKPATDGEILQAVLAAAGELTVQLQAKHELESLQLRWRDNLPRLRVSYLRDLLLGRYTGQAAARLELERTMPDRMRSLFVAVMVELDPLAEGETRYDEQDRSVLQFALDNIAEELMSGDCCFVLSGDVAGTILLFQSKPDEEEMPFMNRVNVMTNKLLIVVRQILKLTASAGIGTACRFADVALSYRQAVQALHERVLLGNHIAVSYRREGPVLPSSLSRRDAEKLLEAGLDSLDEDKCTAAADSFILAEIDAASSSEEVKEAILGFIGILSRHIRARGWMVKEVMKEDYGYFCSIDRLVAKEQIVEWMRRSARRFVRYNNLRYSSASNEIVHHVLATIETELEKAISLQDIAERMYMNISYLSRLFKQETGEAFSNYVTRRKMERAKDLLLEGNKATFVADRLGYVDYSYFTKVFRKYWGIPPSMIKR